MPQKNSASAAWLVGCFSMSACVQTAAPDTEEALQPKNNTDSLSNPITNITARDTHCQK